MNIFGRHRNTWWILTQECVESGSGLLLLCDRAKTRRALDRRDVFRVLGQPGNLQQSSCSIKVEKVKRRPVVLYQWSLRTLSVYLSRIKLYSTKIKNAIKHKNHCIELCVLQSNNVFSRNIYFLNPCQKAGVGLPTKLRPKQNCSATHF